MRTALRVLAVGALAAAAGCAEIGEARRAQDPASAGPGERTVTAREVGLGPGSPLTIERALEISLTCNPSIAISRGNVDAAAARLQQADANYLPQVSASADLSFQKTGQSTSGFPKGTGTVRNQSGSLSVNQLIFDFGKTSASIRQAAEQYLASQIDLASAENDLRFSLRQAFFDVLKQQELVVVDEDTVRQFEKHLEQVKAFYEVGTRLKYDLAKAQVDLGNAQLTLIKQRTTLAVSRATLNRVLGLAEDSACTLVKPAPSTERSETFDQLSELARQGHPQIAAQRARERAASDAIDMAIADFWPQLSLRASGSASGSLTPLSWSVLVGPAIDWLVYSGGEKTGRLKEVVADLRQTRATTARLEQEVFFSLRQAYVQIQDARERLKVDDLTVKSAEENLALVQGRYEAGKASSVELTDAQVALTGARGEQIQATFDYQVALAAVEHAVGAVK